MNVNPGGSQPAMHDTIWDGRYKKWWIQKELQRACGKVLIERGIDAKGMKVDDMRRTFKKIPNFKYEKTKVEKNGCCSRTQVHFYPEISL